MFDKSTVSKIYKGFRDRFPLLYFFYMNRPNQFDGKTFTETPSRLTVLDNKLLDCPFNV